MKRFIPLVIACLSLCCIPERAEAHPLRLGLRGVVGAARVVRNRQHKPLIRGVRGIVNVLTPCR